MIYRAPVSEHLFLLHHIAGIKRIFAQTAFQGLDDDVLADILAAAAKMSETVLAPLSRVGDCHPPYLEGGQVYCGAPFAAGYRAIASGGWVGMAADAAYGGMGLPMAVVTLVNEMMGSACLALQLNPLMTQAQIEALVHHAGPDLQALYLPKLISGEWCGTMNLTESQAGSDVGALQTRAVPCDDGSHAITGQKIFITWADNDFAQNICHMVLARLPDAPAGTKGISLFLVPKFIPNTDGSLGPRNKVHVDRLEHKLGLHGSPTAQMRYEGAKGWLIGAPHQGMQAMFTMMNAARLGVGGQGIAVAEAAYQQALAFAMTRHQGKTPMGGGAIIGHSDVRRMLGQIKADLFSARAIALSCAAAIDLARGDQTGEWQARAAFLTPIAKAFGTDIGNEAAYLALQIHGGTGFIEETGIAQLTRDVRVTGIYEGTNGIQAIDLLGRKMQDGGHMARLLMDEIRAQAGQAMGHYPELAGDVLTAVEALSKATAQLLAQEVPFRMAGAVPYLRAFGQILGAHYHLQAALADKARAPLARIAIKRLLPKYQGLLAEALAPHQDLYDVPFEKDLL